MMKNLLYILLIITGSVFAQAPFEKGNELYRKGKYQEAIDSYEQILSEKRESAEVYFNLGNSYYKLNKIGPAIYNFEKALLLKSGNTDIATNLSIAQKRTVDYVKPTNRGGAVESLRKLHSDAWGWLAIFFSVLMLSFFVMYYLSSKLMLKKLGFTLMAFSSIALLFCLIAGYLVASAIAKERPAIVFSATAHVKSEPVASSADAFTLHEGTKVYVLEKLDNWKKIKLADDKQGWIEETAIKELK